MSIFINTRTHYDQQVRDFNNWVYEYLSKFNLPVKSITLNSSDYKKIAHAVTMRDIFGNNTSLTRYNHGSKRLIVIYGLFREVEILEKTET